MGRKSTCRRTRRTRNKTRRGGRGGLGASSYGVGDRSTTGASSVLAQYTGLSSGGSGVYTSSNLNTLSKEMAEFVLANSLKANVHKKTLRKNAKPFVPPKKKLNPKAPSFQLNKRY